MEVRFEELMVRALGALYSLQFQKKISVEKRWAMHLFCNEENEKWIEDYVDNETTDARKRVQNAETAMMHQQEDSTSGEKAGLTTGKPEGTFEEMLYAMETV